MKLIHLSDLHLGKRVNEFSMLEDQKYILKEILEIVDDEKSVGLIIAGDIYDKSIPPAEAVELFDDFLYALSKRNQQVFVISGNHDSPERIAFGGRLMGASGIHMSPVYDGNILPITISDGEVEVRVYMLPFIKPANVRRFFPDQEINSYTAAVKVALAQAKIDKSKTNILVTHQFVTGASRSDSEDISVGGADNVDASAMDQFDYVALGHIHGPQNISSEKGNAIRYCGTPLKYSFSEANHDKSVTVLEIGKGGLKEIRTVPLKPLRDMREIRGSYIEVTSKDAYKDKDRKDYIHITLTDEEDVIDAVAKLRIIYPNLMKLDYDNKRTRSSGNVAEAEDIQNKLPLQLLEEFYEKQNNQPLSEEQRSFSQKMIEKVWEDEQ